jgi:dihydroxyacetone kinase-like predicted kinase
VAEAAYRAAVTALAATRGQLPALAKAGVVDAGGCGLVLLLGALCGAVGVPVAEPAPDLSAADRLPAGAPEPAGDEDGGSPEYEIQYVLAADQLAVARLRGELAALGDSLVVVGDGAGRWQVHVHVDDAGAAVEAGIRAGRPSRIRITRLTESTLQPAAPHHTGDHHRLGDPRQEGDSQPAVDRQGAASVAARSADPGVAGGSRAAGVVVLVEGDGLVGLCGAAGAGVVDVGGVAPSVARVVAAVRERGAWHTVLVPGAVAWHPVAVRAAEEVRAAGLAVSVVPARSPVQVLAALAVHDPARGRTEDVIAMAEAAAGCRHGRVELASSEALTVVGRCRPGDVLGLVDDDVALIGDDPAAVGVEVLDRLLSGGGELATLVSGAAVPDGLVAGLTGHLGRRWPLVEVTAHHGGQRGAYLLVGVE